jgi:hypothetical protein
MTHHTYLAGSSRNCCRCGKELTDAASLEAGIGPVCRKLDNAVLATMIPADAAAALSAFSQIDASDTPETCHNTLGQVGADLLALDANKDWRATVKRCEWLLSWGQPHKVREALKGIIESLGYVGLLSVINGEAAKGKTTITFEDGRLYMQGPNNKAGRIALKEIKGRMFHPKTDEVKPRWSVPAAQWAAFQTVIVKHWVNHSGLQEAVEAAQSYKPEPKPVEKPKAAVTITETDDGWLKVKSPYNAAFISELKSAFYWKTRKWNGQEKVWEVDVSHKGALLSMIEEHYKEKVEVA